MYPIVIDIANVIVNVKYSDIVFLDVPTRAVVRKYHENIPNWQNVECSIPLSFPNEIRILFSRKRGPQPQGRHQPHHRRWRRQQQQPVVQPDAAPKVHAGHPARTSGGFSRRGDRFFLGSLESLLRSGDAGVEGRHGTAQEHLARGWCAGEVGVRGVFVVGT